MEKSEKWEDERYLFEKLKQEPVFRRWKKEQFDCQRGKCAICGKPMQYKGTETDHILPLYYGGNSEALNMVLCHHACNKNKSTSTSYSRPKWITENNYADDVSRRYLQLRASLLPEEQSTPRDAFACHGTVTKPAPISSPFQTDVAQSKSTDRHIETSNHASILKPALLAIICIVIFASIYIVFGLKKNSSTNNDGDGPATTATNNENEAAKSDDEIRKSLANSLVTEYGVYYDYWVKKMGHSLPKDAANCTSWNGCTLSFPLGGVRTEDGYTYSIHSLEGSAPLTQNATKTNAALYKRARCTDDNNIIGGNNDRDAAAIVELSDGEYYCYQN
ncbi:HNH endonuclease [Candidatus Saccharibacteria bacterium]|nr:HNH endonuclease [Candidatus Saccharibacteria bacterium]